MPNGFYTVAKKITMKSLGSDFDLTWLNYIFHLSCRVLCQTVVKTRKKLEVEVGNAMDFRFYQASILANGKWSNGTIALVITTTTTTI